MIAFLAERMRKAADRLAVADAAGTCTHEELLSHVEAWRRQITAGGNPIPPGAVVSVEGDYSRNVVAAFLAVTANRNIVVPLSHDSRVHQDEFLALAEVEVRVRSGADPVVQFTDRHADHELYLMLRQQHAPGLVLFSSGSTGKSKAAVHNLALLLKKFQVPRNSWRTLVFLQLDHIGGVNTLLYTLSNAGAVVVADDRSPDGVAAAIARHGVELLPTSPTFLNLLLLSGAHERHDLSSLKLITYGTETMPESTLRRVHEAFPEVRLQQTYGLTEVGILRSKSRGDDSLWVRVGGEGYQTKVVDGRLWVKAESAMLGYLNAPAPFDEEGFLDTGDRVEVDGEWMRILGRESDIVNVGGNKVYPAEVESALLQMDNVVDAAVHGEKNPITGQIVVATVRLEHDEAPAVFKARMRQFCRERLPAYKVPAKVVLADGPLYSSRFKRMRARTSAEGASGV